MSENNEAINFRMVRVKDISFNVNERLYVPPTLGQTIKVRINSKLGANPNTEMVVLELTAFYYYETSVTEEQLASMVVQNMFQVVNLKEFFIDKELILPPNFIVTILSISLSHTRALFSKSLDGTAFSNTVMPIMNPEELAKTFFPNMFNSELRNKKLQEVNEDSKKLKIASENEKKKQKSIST